MKKLLYFLIVFVIPCLFFSIVYGDECTVLGAVDSDEIETRFLNNVFRGWSMSSVGSFLYLDDANAALNAVYKTGDDGVLVYGIYMNSGPAFYAHYRNDPNKVGVFATVTTDCTTNPNPVCQDLDGDGLPDDCDIYPDDPTSYSVKMTGYQTTDGTSTGEKTYVCYITDRGDEFCIGTDGILTGATDYVVADGTWISGEDICSDGSSEEPQMKEGDDSDNAQEGGDSDGTLEDGEGDEDSESGTDSDPDASDSDTLKGIQDNTSATADNTKIANNYLKSINAAVESALAYQKLQYYQKVAEAKQDVVDRSEAKSGLSEFKNLDVDSYYNSEKYDGTLTEGTDEGGDYDQPGDLSEESWLTDFISSNPLSIAYNNSGFLLSNSSCSMTFTSSMGTFELSLCEFESGFELAGNILFGLTSLMSIMIIAWK